MSDDDSKIEEWLLLHKRLVDAWRALENDYYYGFLVATHALTNEDRSSE